MSRDEFNKELKIDVKQAEKGLDQINTKLDETDKSLSKVEKTGGVSWNKVAIGITAAVVAVKAVMSQLTKFIDAANRQETALKKVNFLFGDQSDSVIKLSKEIQNLTTVGDEAAQEMMILAKSMGATDENMETITKGAIGLSEALGIDVNSAIKMTTAAIEGQDYTLLNRYLPSLRLAKTEAEKTAIFNETLARSWDLAKEATDTSAGAMEQFKNVVGDLYEVIGTFINKALTPLIKGMTTVIKWIIGSGGQVEAYDKLDLATKRVKESTDGLRKSFDSLTTSAEKQQKAIEQYKQNLDTLGKSAALVRKQTADVLRPFINEVRELDKIAGQTGSTVIRGLTKDFYDLVREFEKAPDSTLLPFMQELLSEMRELISPVMKNAESLNKWVNELLFVPKTLDSVKKEIELLNQQYNSGNITLAEYLENVKLLKMEYNNIKNATEAVDGVELKNLKTKEQTIEAIEEITNAYAELDFELGNLAISEEEIWNLRLTKSQEFLDKYGQVMNGILAIGSQMTQLEMTRIDSRYKKERDALDASELSHEEYQNAIRKLDAKMEQDKRKAYQRQQKIDIAQAAVNTGVAVTNALGTKPFLPLGLIMAGLAATMGALQIATIKSQSFSDGGIPGEDLVISDRKTGNPVAVMNSREYITPASTTNNPVSQGKINEALIADGRPPYFKGAKAPRDSSMSDLKPEFVIENRFDMDGIVTKITEKQNAMTRAGAQIDKL